MYRIWCEVTNGIVGRRQNWLKDDLGYKEFDTYEEAEELASRLRTQMCFVSSAVFSYTAKRVD